MGGSLSFSVLDQKDDVLAKKEQEVEYGCQDRQADRHRTDHETEGVSEPGEKSQPLHLHRENEKEHQLKVRIQPGEGQEHRAGQEGI